MKVLITGATGLIGKAIVKKCHDHGITVHYLTTSKDKIENTEHYKGYYWNPEKKEIDIACFKEVDAIINLAGASISKRWSDSYKKKIINSRIESLDLLKKSIAKNHLQIKQLISASAIGIYPNSLTNYYEESYQGNSSSFLGEVSKQWESAADSFTELNMLVAKIRIGLVLDKQDGALPKLIKPIRFGLGAALGDGFQWQSWIHVKDLANIFVFVLENKLEGVYNGVAPNPVSNQELFKAIAKSIKRPLILPNIPSVFLKLVLGEMYVLLVDSQRVSSNKIDAKGFEYKFPNLLPALENLLEKP
ncbi:TIGR01777 family protein [Formosa maritima]|uniref:TIGR01777 family protein n=2 Tax=Formosa maritima TaxID=2592046 RepID=A0A5D0GF01_9FLAO|nr:TIGR01777 family protein [Formosa maritima]